MQRNEWRMEDYKDRVEAQQKLRKYLGEERWKKITEGRVWQTKNFR